MLKKKQQIRTNRIPIRFVSLALLVALNMSMLLTIGEALAFFNDVEKSETSNFEIGVLNFSLNSSNDFLPNLGESQAISSRTVNVDKDGTLEFKYKVKVENFVGGLCDYLNLKDDLSNSFQLLSDYISATTTFSAMPSLVFTANSSSYDESLQGEICNFDFVFEAWQENLNSNDQGFTDKEIINSIVKMGYWDSDIVMNEFLPNADNYQEFIEFYNKGASTIDMDGFYVMADGNRIDVNTINTNTYSDGLTTIDPSSWLVITTGGDILGDTSGTLTLYNPNNVEMDSYTYDGADHNINNNPGWTNDLVLYLPFDGDLTDKSGNGNNGINHGTSFAGGKINQALSLDGNDDYIEVPDSSSLDITNAITLEAWVYPESWDNAYENNILTKSGETSGLGVWSLHHKTTSDGFRFELVDSGTPYPLFENIPSTGFNQWYHIVGTYDGSDMDLYVDGSLSNSTTTYTGLINTNDESLIIGKKLWWGSHYSYWDGLIDEVKIYNRALSASEVSEHYNDIGVSGEVPVDKSYARIPDGIGGWVDPIPTPAQPNRVTIEEALVQGALVEEETLAEVITEHLKESFIFNISAQGFSGISDGAVIEETIADTDNLDDIIIEDPVIFVDIGSNTSVPVIEEMVNNNISATTNFSPEFIEGDDPAGEESSVSEGSILLSIPLTEDEIILEEELIEEGLIEEGLIEEGLIEEELTEEEPVISETTQEETGETGEENEDLVTDSEETIIEEQIVAFIEESVVITTNQEDKNDSDK